ncbi:hypothetical protein HYH03_015218 [Edaphochlamys debaryana]|uniref:Cyclic nucleotide-binding domain-containing protein n=1 Tax=Edaphochlamys debaryana TaxID=47281 RepID=A0A835XL82_9CHLO|nr:hypothetical protein HYH03_015218 [Edaphochlamys debaryana]|eukprot:KAG2486123.1 hypothetical protein HYH03_015218 [Edaphochlamys debaryana]
MTHHHSDSASDAWWRPAEQYAVSAEPTARFRVHPDSAKFPSATAPQPTPRSGAPDVAGNSLLPSHHRQRPRRPTPRAASKRGGRRPEVDVPERRPGLVLARPLGEQFELHHGDGGPDSSDDEDDLASLLAAQSALCCLRWRLWDRFVAAWVRWWTEPRVHGEDDHEAAAVSAAWVPHVGYGQGLRKVAWTTAWAVIHPDSIVRAWWDSAIHLLLLYVAIALPFVLGFDQSYTKTSPMGIVDFVVNAFFIVDIYLNFRTGVLVTSLDGVGAGVRTTYSINRRTIAINYLSGWFALDLLAALPWGVMTESLGAFMALAKLPRLLKLFRLLRLVRLLRLGPAMQKSRLLRNMATAQGITVARVLIYAMFTILILHLSACAWFFAAVLSSPTLENTWVSNVNLEDADLVTKYITSLYFVVITYTTIGYGDIVPVTTGERVLTCIGMLFGVVTLSYIVSTANSIMGTANKYEMAKAELDDAVDEFLTTQPMPSSLSARVKAYYGFVAQKQFNSDLDRDVLAPLPTELRREVVRDVYTPLLRRLPLLAACERLHSGLVLELAAALKLELYSCGDCVVMEGDWDTDMYFVSDGRLAVRQFHQTSAPTAAQKGALGPLTGAYQVAAQENAAGGGGGGGGGGGRAALSKLKAGASTAAQAIAAAATTAAAAGARAAATAAAAVGVGDAVASPPPPPASCVTGLSAANVSSEVPGAAERPAAAAPPAAAYDTPAATAAAAVHVDWRRLQVPSVPGDSWLAIYAGLLVLPDDKPVQGPHTLPAASAAAAAAAAAAAPAAWEQLAARRAAAEAEASESSSAAAAPPHGGAHALPLPPPAPAPLPPLAAPSVAHVPGGHLPKGPKLEPRVRSGGSAHSGGPPVAPTNSVLFTAAAGGGGGIGIGSGSGGGGGGELRTASKGKIYPFSGGAKTAAVAPAPGPAAVAPPDLAPSAFAGQAACLEECPPSPRPSLDGSSSSSGRGDSVSGAAIGPPSRAGSAAGSGPGPDPFAHPTASFAQRMTAEAVAQRLAAEEESSRRAQQAAADRGAAGGGGWGGGGGGFGAGAWHGEGEGQAKGAVRQTRVKWRMTYDPNVPSRRLRTIKTGQYFGEYGCLTGCPRTASVVASRMSEAYRLARSDLAAAMSQWPALRIAWAVCEDYGANERSRMRAFLKGGKAPPAAALTAGGGTGGDGGGLEGPSGGGGAEGLSSQARYRAFVRAFQYQARAGGGERGGGVEAESGGGGGGGGGGERESAGGMHRER